MGISPDGHTLTVIVNRTEMSANSGRDTIFDWPVTGSGTLGTATVTARDAADSQPFIAPSDRTVLGIPNSNLPLAYMAAALTCPSWPTQHRTAQQALCKPLEIQRQARNRGVGNDKDRAVLDGMGTAWVGEASPVPPAAHGPR